MRLTSYLGGGLYGSVFLATNYRGDDFAVKVVTSTEEDMFPPQMEVELAKQFAKAGLGFKPNSEMYGFEPSRLTHEDMHCLLAGPGLQQGTPKAPA